LGTNTIYAYTQVPSMSTWLTYWSAVDNTGYSSTDHQDDIIQSMGSSNDDVTAEANDYLASTLIGAPHTYTTNTFLENYPGIGDVYTTNLNVWVPPGAVDYVYRTTNSSSNP